MSAPTPDRPEIPGSSLPKAAYEPALQQIERRPPTPPVASRSGSVQRRATADKCRRVAILGGIVAAAVGVITLLGWAMGSHFLASGDPGWGQPPHWIPMSPRAALGFIVLGYALVLRFQAPARKASRVGAALLAVVMMAWGVVETWHHLTGISPITDADIYEGLRLGDALREALMSPITAISFVLASLALGLLCGAPNRFAGSVATGVACLVGSVNLVAALGYMLEAQLLFGGVHATIALPTALGWIALSVALIAGAGPACFPLSALVGPSPRALLLRAFLPAVLIMVITLGVMRNAVSQMLNSGPVAREFRKRPEVQLSRAINTLLSTVIGPLVAILTVGFVARRIGASLEKANAELTKTLEELRVARRNAESATVERDFFLAQVSHELRTPLNHVLGFCQLLELTGLDPHQLGDVRKIHRAGNHLQSLIDDILDYQKIIMGQIPIEWEDFEAAPWMTEIVESMEPKLREKGNRLELSCAADLGQVRSNRKRFRQILTNLLSNAGKFTTQGVVAVLARRECAEDREWIEVSVADTGKGISAENLGKLFKPFGQLSDKRDNPEGTGLGLVICKSLCEKMGGTIRVNSVLGQGTTFTVRLPATPTPVSLESLTPAPSPQPRPAPPAATVHAERAFTVLVVDDDPQVGELMRRFLEKEGFDIHVALTGVQALEAVKALRPDVITLDVLMPGIDGWSVLAALKNDHEVADIPVIILSIVDDRSKGFMLGANEYVIKPVDWERLAGQLLKYRTRAGGSVLIVDDDAHWRDLCRRSLEQSGWKVVEADDGESALRRLVEHRPTLILLDLMLPVMNGFEFLERLRGHPEWRDITIVVMTAKELSQQERKQLNGRVEDILEKGRRRLDDLLDDIRRDVTRFAPPGRGSVRKELTHV